jgi:hypothetical protein
MHFSSAVIAFIVTLITYTTALAIPVSESSTASVVERSEGSPGVHALRVREEEVGRTPQVSIRGLRMSQARDLGLGTRVRGRRIDDLVEI